MILPDRTWGRNKPKPFETLADLRWFGFGEQAETSTSGQNVMQSVYIDGKELENWRALEKLKIY